MSDVSLNGTDKITYPKSEERGDTKNYQTNNTRDQLVDMNTITMHMFIWFL